MNAKRKRIVVWLPAILLFAIIIYFAVQPGELSIRSSQKMADWLLKNTETGNDDPGIHIRGNMAIRYLAIFFLYSLLTVSVEFAVYKNGIRRKLKFIYVCLLALPVAILDEFVQIFGEDRYGDFVHLLYDWVGIFFVSILILIWEMKHHKMPETYEPKVNFINIRIDNLTFDQATDQILSMAKERKEKYIVTPNVDHIINLQKDEEFRSVYQDADLVVADGMPLLWIADSFDTPIVEKVSGSDLLPAICKKTKEEISIFLLGGIDGAATQAAENIEKKYDRVRIVGTYEPPLHFEKEAAETEKIKEMVSGASPDILVVGLGSPKQEKFIHEYRNQMKFGVALPIGAAIDFQAGRIRRAPVWMQRSGLEWLYRFMQEPGRLFQRYFVDDIKIFNLVWKYRDTFKK